MRRVWEVRFFCREVALQRHLEALAAFDSHVFKVFSGLEAIVPMDLHGDLAKLSTRPGGLGIVSLTDHVAAAFIASTVAYYD